MLWKIALLVLFVSCSSTKESRLASSPNLVFTITDGISHPESVLFSKNDNAIFVSNIPSGNPVEVMPVGNISKYTTTGKVIAAPWVKGLRAPKGMALVGNELYVSDVDQVVKIDVRNAKVLQAIKIPGAKFLNDVAADKSGNVYISDMMTDTIHVWNKDGVKVWKKSPELRSPNGLFVNGNEQLLIASWGQPIADNFTTKNPGTLMTIPVANPAEKLHEEATLPGNLDGISEDNKGTLWISDWMNGNIYAVQRNGTVQKKMNLRQGTADLFYSKELNLLFVPQMYESKVMAFKVE